MAHVIPIMGVFDDGTPADPSLPAEEPVKFHRGESVEFQLRIVRPTGAPFALDPVNDTVSFSLRKTPEEGDALITKAATITDPEDGGATCALSIVDTKLLEPGWYVLDVWWGNATDAQSVVEDRPVRVSTGALTH